MTKYSITVIVKSKNYSKEFIGYAISEGQAKTLAIHKALKDGLSTRGELVEYIVKKLS